jgi:hypothetical protein
LDQTDEYFIDRRAGLLYYLATDSTAAANDELVVSQGVSSLWMDSVANVRFDGIRFGYCRGTGVQVKDSVNVTVANADIRNVGGHGVSVDGCTNVSVVESNVQNVGCRGVVVSCGSTTTLEAGSTLRTCPFLSLWQFMLSHM